MNRIKQLRNERNINQDVLAKLLGIEIAGISKLETGRVPLKDEYIVKLAEFFGVTTDYILGKSDIRNPEKVEIDTDKLYIGLSTNDYENITDKQKEQITELARLILKDNLKNKDKKQDEQ